MTRVQRMTRINGLVAAVISTTHYAISTTDDGPINGLVVADTKFVVGALAPKFIYMHFSKVCSRRFSEVCSRRFSA
jgi:hypothetical protein